MNQFFLKPLLPSSCTDQQSDYERLLQLCESYGLNEQETQQLMDEFKKGGYDKVNSMKSSLNQSMMSDQYEENQKQGSDALIYKKQQLRTYSNNFYQNENSEQVLPSKSTDRFYGYEEEQHDQMQQNYGQQNGKYTHQQDDQISYNQMTFNHEQEVQERVPTNVDMKNNQIKNFVPDLNKNLKTNESKNSLLAKNAQTPHNNSQKNSSHHLSHNHSTLSEHSNSYHSGQNQQLNPVYVKQLIQNFQLLEKEADDLKQKNIKLTKQQNVTKIQNQLLKKQLELIKKQRDQLKIKSSLFQSQNYQLKSAIESQKAKAETFKSIKERDSQIIQGLKDSILQFTAILKEKDAQSNDLQNKLIVMYEKNEKLTQQIYGSGSGQTQQNGGSVGRNFQKLGSKRSIVYQSDQKEEKSSVTSQNRKDQFKDNENQPRKQIQMKRPKDRSQVRRQLSEILLNGMNNQQSLQMGVSQSNKQLIREVSTSKIVQLQNQNHQGMQKSSTNAQRRPPRQIKENVFVGVQVEGIQNSKGLTNKKVITQEQSKKRGSSRVDIKKYKGMIEELRNSYSNVPGNMIR